MVNPNPQLFGTAKWGYTTVSGITDLGEIFGTARGQVFTGIGMTRSQTPWYANVPTMEMSGPSAQGSAMYPGQVLQGDESISSPNGKYTFTYQADGNCVLYRNSDHRALWASNTYKTPEGITIMQGDGNLVTYDRFHKAVFSSGTWRYPGSYLVMQDDGNLVIYTPTRRAVWATNTVQPAPPLSLLCNNSSAPLRVDQRVAFGCSASGGMPPFRWSIVNGSLPSGLSLGFNANEASITGTPSASGNYDFSVEVVDSSPRVQAALQQYSGWIPPSGIGTYDLLSLNDQSIPFDYGSTGKQDHLILYRPGDGILYILKSNGGQFSPVYASFQGIGTYDLKSVKDRIVPFDYDGSGKLDHLVMYRPGDGIVYILKNNNGRFTLVFASEAGIGGYDLRSNNDMVFAFDYDGSGKQDHLILYRPGDGILYILKNNGGQFSPVYASFQGIGTYDLKSIKDRVVPFDYDGSGKLDHLVMYRPGDGIVYILKNNKGQFSPVYASGDGIGGYDLRSDNDKVFTFDYDGSIKQDHLALYRPGSGTIWILRNVGGYFSPVFAAGAPGNGIGGYDLASINDRGFAFDYNDSGKQDHLALYRPGTGVFWILENNRGVLSPVYVPR